MFKSANCLILYDGKLLLLLRDDIPTITDPNCWSIPGGHPEADETPEQTMLREIKEETNLELKNYQFLGMLDSSAVFLAKLNDEEIKSIKLGDEGQQIGFYSYEDMQNMNLTKPLKENYQNLGMLLKII